MTQNLLTPGEFAPDTQTDLEQKCAGAFDIYVYHKHISTLQIVMITVCVLITMRALKGSSICSVQVLVKCWSSSFT